MPLSTVTTDSTTDQVLQLITQISPGVTRETDLLQSGVLDSLNLVKLLVALESRFGMGISLDDVDIDAFRSVRSIAEMVESGGLHRSDEPVTLEPAGSASTWRGRIAPVAPVAPLREDLTPALRTIFREEFSVDVPNSATNLFQSGLLDSMMLIQLILRMETQFGVRLPLHSIDLSSFESLDAIADLLYAEKSALRQTA